MRRQLAVRGGELAVRVADDAALDDHRRGLEAQPSDRLGDEQGAYLGAHLRDGGAGGGDRHAAGGQPLVRAVQGVGGQHPHLGDVQFVGGQLAQRGEDALAQLHLADPDGDGAVGVDAHPSGQPRVGHQRGRQLDRPALLGALALVSLLALAGSAGAQDGADHPPVHPASAQMPGQRGDDGGLVRCRLLGQQCGGADQDARDAVAALRRLLGQHRFLDRVQRRAVGQPFDSGDLSAGGGPQRQVTGRHRPAVHQHDTRAALAAAAAEPAPLEVELGAQGVQQRGVRWSAEGARLTVDGQLEGLRHEMSSTCRPRLGVDAWWLAWWAPVAGCPLWDCNRLHHSLLGSSGLVNYLPGTILTNSRFPSGRRSVNRSERPGCVAGKCRTVTGT